MSNGDQSIPALIEQFMNASAWRHQIAILRQIGIAADFRHRALIEKLTALPLSPFVLQRIDGILKDLDLKEQLRLTAVNTRERTTPRSAPATPPLENPGEVVEASESAPLNLVESHAFDIDACNLSAIDQVLLERTIKKLVGTATGIKLRELKRGFSGSDVYLVRIKKDRHGNAITMPKALVAKIGSAQKLKQEYVKAQEASTLSAAHPNIYEELETRGCLLQEFATTALGDDRTTSLRIALAAPYRQREQERILKKLINYINSIHEEIRLRTNLQSETRKSVIEAMKICDEQIRLERLEYRLKVIGLSKNDVYIANKFRIRLINPLWYLLRLRTEQPSITYYEQHVHGDLHTENVQIDSNDVAHCIDWGNFGEGHSSLDYALLEASVWAHSASHDLLIEEVDTTLREIPFPGDAASFEVDPITDDGNSLARCKATVKQIRSHATSSLHEPKGFHYAVGLFFAAVQQLQYEDANLRAMLVLANHALQKLEEEWGYIEG